MKKEKKAENNGVQRLYRSSITSVGACEKEQKYTCYLVAISMAINLKPKVRRLLLDKRQQKRYVFLLMAFVFTILYRMGKWPFASKNIALDPHNLPYSFQDYSGKDEPFFRGCTDTNLYLQDPDYAKMNASFVMLTRNEELGDVLKTMRSIEGHFNQWFGYPYVFLNDRPFTDHFKGQIQAATNATVEFGTINETAWEFPAEVRDSLLFKTALEDQNDRGIMYGNMESYHKMCRFYSGLFYKHPLVSKYEWYWRIEPDVDFFCDISYDPFLEMAKNNKKYGFTVLITELYWTVPNLFRTTKSFIRKTAGLKENLGTLWKLFTFNYNILDTEDEEISRWVNYPSDAKPKLTEKLMVDFLLENRGQLDNEEDLEGIQYLVERARSKMPLMEDSIEGEDYNLCHFWSNFEIARVDLFDNEVYNAYFKYLEESNGFWTERWGDAPIHSIGLGMILDLEDVHYFRDIGYRHSSLEHCPKNAIQGESNSGEFDDGFDFGCGCRCVCPKNEEDIEDNSTPCMDIFFELLQGKEYEKDFPGCYKPSIKDKDVIEEIRRDNFRVIE